MIYYILTLIIMFSITISLIYINIKHNYYKNIKVKGNICGFEIADKIFKENKLNNIYIVEKRNSYVNTYEQNRDTLKLTSNNFHGENISSIANSIYEANSILLMKKGHKSLKIYNNLEKILSICSKIGIVSTLFGIILWKNLFIFGILLLTIVFVYQVIMIKYVDEVIEKSIVYIEKSKILTYEEKVKTIEVIKMSKIVNIANLGYFIIENI